MLEDLFLTDTPVENSTGGVIELSENIEEWPEEIQSILSTQIPALMENPGRLSFDTVDQDKLYAKGSYSLPMGGSDDSIIIPILIKSGKMFSPDVYIVGDKFMPLDPEDISDLLSSPELSENLISEEDVPASAYTGFSNRVTPPGAYGSGYVNSYASKTGSLKSLASSKDIDDIYSRLESNRDILVKLAGNSVARGCFSRLMNEEENSEKTAGLNGKVIFDGDKVIFSHGRGQFSIKSASVYNDQVAVGHTECNGSQLISWLKEAGLDAGRIINDLKNTGMAMTWDDTVKTASDKNAEITSVGSYTCYDASTLKPETATVLGYIKTASGDKRYLAVNSENQYALQRDIIGMPASTMKIAAAATLPKVGDTITLKISEKEAELAAPVKVTSVTSFNSKECRGTSISGSSCMGKVAFVLVDDDRITRPIATKYVPESCFVEKGASAWFIPSSYPIIKLSGEKNYIKTAEDLKDQIYLRSEGATPLVTAKLWKVNSSDIGIKIGSHEPSIIPAPAAMLLIRQSEGSGVLDSMAKIASGKIKTINLDTGKASRQKYLEAGLKRYKVNSDPRDASGRFSGKDAIVSAEKEMKKLLSDDVKLSALKVAASLDEEEPIDSILALNYLTPENLEEFKAVVPDLQGVEQMLAKLLISIRLGNTVAEEKDVQNVMFALHDLSKMLQSRI